MYLSLYQVSRLELVRTDRDCKSSPSLRGNHLSNTTCPTRVFFKSGEYCSKLN